MQQTVANLKVGDKMRRKKTADRIEAGRRIISWLWFIKTNILVSNGPTTVTCNALMEIHRGPGLPGLKKWKTWTRIPTSRVPWHHRDYFEILPISNINNRVGVFKLIHSINLTFVEFYWFSASIDNCQNWRNCY